ncbi:MAG: 50S ribosomal protein L9 [Acidimicrobiales bacterium]|nr:50S ribosomal protein L9 [Acidimicrobiales bacterium]|tara:strand:+ start:197 stop:643 length:447 start_codon:yes stop_codon:yes gene_type:complete
MKVLLRSDVDGLGRTGDIVEVASGHARNFLLPRGLAVVASSGVTAQAEAMQKKRALKAIEDKSDAEEIVSRLDGIIIQISANASEAGKLFGSVGVAEISQALQDQVGLEIDRKDISGETAKEVGTHQFTLHLHPEVEMQVTVDVQSEV